MMVVVVVVVKRRKEGEAHLSWVRKQVICSRERPSPPRALRTTPCRYLDCSEWHPLAPSFLAAVPSALSGLSPFLSPASLFLPGTSGHPPQLGSYRTCIDWHLQS